MSEKPRGRVRFVECRLEPQAKGVRVEVALANHAGKTFTGVSAGEGERGKDPETDVVCKFFSPFGPRR